jgi:hypothetical protein
MWSNAYAERWVRTARSECTGSAAAARTNGTWALTGTDTEANPVSDDDLGPRNATPAPPRTVTHLHEQIEGENGCGLRPDARAAAIALWRLRRISCGNTDVVVVHAVGQR